MRRLPRELASTCVLIQRSPIPSRRQVISKDRQTSQSGPVPWPWQSNINSPLVLMSLSAYNRLYQNPYPPFFWQSSSLETDCGCITFQPILEGKGDFPNETIYVSSGMHSKRFYTRLEACKGRWDSRLHVGSTMTKIVVIGRQSDEISRL